MPTPRIERVINRAIWIKGCLVWTGAKRGDGYGKINVAGKDVRVHRWVYEQTVGPIGEGLLLRHSTACHTKLCIYPEHLTPGTHADNAADQIARGLQVAGDRCRKGHLYTPENTRMNSNGYRSCRICNRSAERARYRARQ